MSSPLCEVRERRIIYFSKLWMQQMVPCHHKGRYASKGVDDGDFVLDGGQCVVSCELWVVSDESVISSQWTIRVC